MTMKVDETGMLHLLKMTLTQKTKIDNFFGDPSYPFAPVTSRRGFRSGARLSHRLRYWLREVPFEI